MTRHARIVDRAVTRLKVKQLRLLVAVGQFGSIQTASRHLQVSQPAATKLIQDLEVDFEVKLFERTNRGVVPTACGDALIRHAKLIIAQISNAAQELDDLTEGNSGRVVVGTLLAAAPNLLPKAIELIVKERPNVAVKVVEGPNDALMPALMSGEVDLVVGRLPAYRYRSKLVQEKLFDDKIVAVARRQHPLADKARVSFAQIKPYSWILPPVETTLRPQIDEYFLSQDQYVPRVILESVSYLTNRSLLQTQDAICLMPNHVGAHDVLVGDLARIQWNVPFGFGPVGVSYLSADSLSPAGSAFLAGLRTTARSLQDS